MSQRLWEYRTANELTGLPATGLCWDGHCQAMVCDHNGNLLFHLIETSDNPGWYADVLEKTGASDQGQLLLHEPFMLAPGAFRHSNLPGSDSGETYSKEIGRDLFVCTQAAKGVHAVYPLYRHAETLAEKHTNLILAYVCKHQAMILFFRNQVCEMANLFPVTNESELLYFCAAPIKKAGLRVDQVRVELLSGPEESREYMKTLSRFLPDVHVSRISLPYPAGEYPPYSPEAFLLYQYLQCELPAAR